MHLGSGVFAAERFGEAGVQSHPNPRLGLRVGPLVRGQRALGLRAGSDGGVGVRERREDGVTLGEQRDTVTRAQGTTKDLPVLCEHRPILGAEQLGQPGRSLYVGKEECHQSARQVQRCRHG